MEFHVVTIFPDMIENYLKAGILGRANRDGLIQVKAHNLRDFALNRYGQIDDGIFGAGKGMLFRPEPLKGMLSLIKEASPERVRDELYLMLEERDSTGAFRLMHLAGLLKEVLPELESMEGVPQTDLSLFSLQVFTNILGGGMSSRLFQEVRRCARRCGRGSRRESRGRRRGAARSRD